MHVQSLSVVDFRNYAHSQTEFSPDLNLIFGKNAQGKTNILEALYLLCLGRSFRLAKNQDLIKTASNSFTVQGTISTDRKIEQDVVVNYVRDGKKEISVNRKRLQSHSRIFGQFPIVVMAPDEFKITTGGPSERRKFIDLLLSQVSPSYLADLQSYNRILKHRNRILQDVRAGGNLNKAAMQPWTQKLVEVGSCILLAREKFIKDFSRLLKPAYSIFSEKKEDLEILVDSSIAYEKLDQIEPAFYEELERNQEKERILGNTLVGPHRDNLVFKIGAMDLRTFGSRGEHKSVLISLKIAEFNYIKKVKDETPVLLLDDCYSELDENREKTVFASLAGLGQTFLTSPKEKLLQDDHQVLAGHETNKFYIEGGHIERRN